MTSLPMWLNDYLARYESPLRHGLTVSEQVELALSPDKIDGLKRLAFILLRPDVLIQEAESYRKLRPSGRDSDNIVNSFGHAELQR